MQKFNKQILKIPLLLVALAILSTSLGISASLYNLKKHTTPTLNAQATPANTYPPKLANAPKDSSVDRWGMLNRECTSYAAWKVASTFGDMPNWTTTNPKKIPNANRWPALAAAAGFATGATAQVHSVAIDMEGSTGHAMWVEQVNGDGTMQVSMYNANSNGNFSYTKTHTWGYLYIYFGTKI